MGGGGWQMGQGRVGRGDLLEAVVHDFGPGVRYELVAEGADFAVHD